MWDGALQSWSEDMVFGNEHKEVKNSVCDIVDPTSKYYEFSREKYLATMAKICMKPALYVNQ